MLLPTTGDVAGSGASLGSAADGGLVYRYQTHVQVQNGHWREFHALLTELNATMEAKGLVPFQVWESSFGPWNGALLIADYESLAGYEREHDAMHADPACMQLWRQMVPHFEGIPWTDLWWTPSGPG